MESECHGFFLFAHQVFLVPAPAKSLSPVWHFVVDPGPEGPWKHVPSRLLPPSCVPLHFRELGLAVVFQQTEDPEPLGKAAVRAGINLYDKQLRCLLRAHAGKLPEFGTGANGGVRRRDVIQALIELFFADQPNSEKNECTKPCLGHKSLRVVLTSNSCRPSVSLILRSGSISNHWLSIAVTKWRRKPWRRN